MMSETTITLDSREEAILLFGSRDSYLKEIRSALGLLQMVGRGDQIIIKGGDDQLALAERVFAQLRQMLRDQGSLSAEDVKTVLEVVTGGGERLSAAPGAKPAEGFSRYVRPRTDGQARYVRAMREHDLTLSVGPAGTGKTWLAVGMAVSLLRQAAVKKIVLVRPAVEAGERLGFLPGDIVAKVNPYLRPLFDALNDMMEPEQVKRYMENDIIEICPLAYMRGSHAERGGHHPGRGAEHDHPADEDVPDADGQRLEDHRDRRRDAGGLAQADAERPDRRRAAAARRGADRHRASGRGRHRAQPVGSANPAGLRG